MKSSPLWFNGVINNCTYLMVVVTLIYISIDFTMRNNLRNKKNKYDNAFKNYEVVTPRKSPINNFII